MDGTIPIIQVVFGGLLVVAILAVLGLVTSALCLHALGGVKTRMVTSDRLDVVKTDLERHLEHKVNGATQPLTRAVDELRESLGDSNAAVAGIKSSNDTLVRQVDLMSHNLMLIHKDQMKQIIDLAVAAGRHPHAPSPPEIPLPAAA